MRLGQAQDKHLYGLSELYVILYPFTFAFKELKQLNLNLSDETTVFDSFYSNPNKTFCIVNQNNIHILIQILTLKVCFIPNNGTK